MVWFHIVRYDNLILSNNQRYEYWSTNVIGPLDFELYRDRGLVNSFIDAHVEYDWRCALALGKLFRWWQLNPPLTTIVHNVVIIEVCFRIHAHIVSKYTPSKA